MGHVANTKRWDAFLSYNSEERDAVETLARRLLRDGIGCWLDCWELAPGELILPSLEAAMKASASCVFFIGPSGNGPCQKEEMLVALTRRQNDAGEGRRFPVIPVLLPGAERGEKGTMPDFLRIALWAEFRESILDEEAYVRLKCGIRGQPPPRRGSASALHEGQCPYKGLEYFDVDDRPFFFGRESRTDWLLNELRPKRQGRQGNRFLGIVGASGSGKSSLARAGLLAELKQDRIAGSAQWPLIICRPGGRPLENLATALYNNTALREHIHDVGDLIDLFAKPGEERRLHLIVAGALHGDEDRRVVILVDQFEELFTLCSDETQRRAFVDNLLYAATITDGKTIVVLTLRADFYGHCAPYRKLAAALSEHQELVSRMEEEELRDAIMRPAEECGSPAEDGLADLLVQDMRGQDGGLPLLQHALRTLWEMRDGPRITVANYRTIGGLEGALERHADKVFHNFTEKERAICREVLLRLTRIGDRTEDTKRCVPLRDLLQVLGESPEAQEVIDTLAAERLITTSGRGENLDEATVEVAHEALIRGWPRLREWLDKDRESLRIHQTMHEDAERWERYGRKDGYVYQREPLAKAVDWYREHRESILPLESEFLEAGVGQLVKRLNAVEIGYLPRFLEELSPFLDLARGFLERLCLDTPEHGRERLYAALALLPLDAGQEDYLRERLLGGDTVEFGLILGALGKREKSALTTWLWNTIEDEHHDPDRRRRAGMALAAYDPPDTPDSSLHWEGFAGFLAEQLVSTVAFSPYLYAVLVDAFRPTRNVLLSSLASIFRIDPNPIRRSWATNMLAEFAEKEPEWLVDLLCDADKKEFPVLFKRLQSHGDRAIELLEIELLRTAPADASEQNKDHLAKRQANAAVALLHLGSNTLVWPLLLHTADPRRRSYLLHLLRPLGVEPKIVVERLLREEDVSSRRALILALGDLFSDGRPDGAPMIAEILEKLIIWHRDDPDSGIHGATEWVLRRWEGDELVSRNLQGLDTRKLDSGRCWYLNSQGQTMMVIPGPVTFLMGSPLEEEGRDGGEGGKIEQQHKKRIGRSYAIAMHTITVGQFQSFRPQHEFNNEYAPGVKCPVNMVTWYDAAAYCNWLSEREGIPLDQWCYSQGGITDSISPTHHYLHRTGYRLPTEAEWEYACRAGATTSRFYGESEELLEKYAWHSKNSQDRWLLEVGTLMPNDFGLFDMLGNSLEWCHEKLKNYVMKDVDAVSIDEEDPDPVQDKEVRVLRGGAFNDSSRFIRSARRTRYQPSVRLVSTGFRVARTLL